MKRYRPRLALREDVTIERNGNYAVIRFKDNLSDGINLGIGPEIATMTDEDIVNLHNEVVRSQLESATNWRPTEIAEGRPQIKFHRSSQTWSAEGHVLRCMIESGTNGLPAIDIDGKILSWEEFGKMINSFSDWGMRIMFVSEDQLSSPPQPEIRKSPKRISKKVLEELAEREKQRAERWGE